MIALAPPAPGAVVSYDILLEGVAVSQQMSSPGLMPGVVDHIYATQNTPAQGFHFPCDTRYI